MRFAVRIANTNIRINSVYSGIYELCNEYITDENVHPDIEICTNFDAVYNEFERLKQTGEEIYSFKAVENLLIHRRITEAMLDYDILLMHGAVIAVDNESYLFTGKSGTGKTTHIKKWIENAQGSYVVNGDKPFIIIDSDGTFACGSPWCGKENYGTNAIVPLRSIVFMERSNNNEMEPEDFKAILPSLLEQTHKPTDVAKMKKTLELLRKLKDRVSFFKFRFDNYKVEAFQTSFDALTGQSCGDSWAASLGGEGLDEEGIIRVSFN